MSNLTKVLHAGMTEELPEFLKRKVYPTNFITLILFFFIAIPFTIISIIYFDFLAFYPGIGGLICIGIIYVNFIGGIYYTRFVLSLIPIFLGAIYNAYLSNDGEQPLPPLYLIELSFTMIPFVIFDLKERIALTGLSLFCTLIISTFPLTNNWFICDIDSTVLRTGWLSILTILLGIFFCIGCILGLALLNKKSENNTEALLKDTSLKNEELKQAAIEQAKSLKEIEEKNLIENRQKWSAEGITMLNQLVRDHEDEQLYFKVTSKLVHYVNAHQAGFFITTQETKPRLKLVGSFAFEVVGTQDYIVAPEQAGLLGQSFKNKTFLYLCDIPESYVSITSGLGQKNPVSLFILPLRVNDTIEGMLELAFFRKLEQYEIDFLLKAGESLGAFIQANRLAAKTNELLIQTMNQAEELKAQEEELRQNLEEMETINEESNKKVEFYIQQIEELKYQLSLVTVKK